MRPVGFGHTADVAVDLLDDDRILDAVELAGTNVVVAYLAVLTASWGRGERMTIAQAVRRAPGAYRLLEALDELRDALTSVGLLDPDGRIPASTWASWYEPARASFDRAREQRSKAGSWDRGRRPPKAHTNGRSTVVQRPVNPTYSPTSVPNGTEVSTEDPTPVVAASSGSTIYCVDYQAHQSEHYRPYRGGPFVCRICGVAPGSPSLAELIARHG